MKGCLQGTVWISKIICEFMPHVVGQAQYVEGVLEGVVGIKPVCISREPLQGQTGINPGCSNMKHLVRTKQGS